MKFFHRLNHLLSDVAAKGFFHLLSANVLIQLVAFASQLFVAGILSPEDVGRIKIITTFLSVFSIIGGMGLNASTLKLCSENRSEAKQRNFSVPAWCLRLFPPLFFMCWLSY
jgi:O-antigen/teichoic acid export membrane protein